MPGGVLGLIAAAVIRDARAVPRRGVRARRMGRASYPAYVIEEKGETPLPRPLRRLRPALGRGRDARAHQGSDRRTGVAAAAAGKGRRAQPASPIPRARARPRPSPRSRSAIASSRCGADRSTPRRSWAWSRRIASSCTTTATKAPGTKPWRSIASSALGDCRFRHMTPSEPPRAPRNAKILILLCGSAPLRFKNPPAIAKGCPGANRTCASELLRGSPSHSFTAAGDLRSRVRPASGRSCATRRAGARVPRE